MTVLIAGGGIGGMTMALTCHQLGIPAKVFESVRELKPLGVGINLQPNAVRELYDLGFEGQLDTIGVETKEWALVGRSGNDVWAEPRGVLAGYKWPQYSVHRGQLQMMLYEAVLDRLGPDSVMTGHRVVGFENVGDEAVAIIETADDQTFRESGDVLIGADGLHSALRSQMYPAEGEPLWGGAIMWRGTSTGVPIRSGASFVLAGHLDQRVVCYPISQPDPDTGLATINWITELTFDTDGGWPTSDWNKQVSIDTFMPQFEDWIFDWLDVPAMVRGSSEVFEYPMVDRDPVDHWVEGRVALMGDAAHVMYPVGSNGASQAIVDARVIGAAMVEHGLSPAALLSYEDQLIEDLSALVLRNRGAGPIGILGVVDERCGGIFTHIEDVIPSAEIEDFMARYKQAAGFAMETLNNAPPTIAPSAAVEPTT
ncbi:MAG: 2-polyprenyl-6-methoxyphenol hydroxylase-like FAD-dependent oxidoreductase [Acidimicrobiales bacterium]|jgi:5-methylphenazine-1-carboxylate 1-monooxygenase